MIYNFAQFFRQKDSLFRITIKFINIFNHSKSWKKKNILTKKHMKKL